MKGLGNMKIGAKLLAGFIVVALITGVMGVIAITSINQLEKADTQMYKTMTVPLAEMGRISTAFQRIRINIRDIMLSPDEETEREMRGRIDERFKEIDTISTSFAATIWSDEMKALWVRYDDAKVEFEKQVELVLSKVEAGLVDEAVDLMAPTGSSGIASEAFKNVIEEVFTYKTTLAGKMSEDNKALAGSVTTTMIIVMAVVVLVAVALGVFLSAIISSPLRKTLTMIQELGRGHLGMRLKMTNRDEVGQMAQAMDAFADTLQNGMVRSIQMIAAGDMSAQLTPADDKDEIVPAIQACIRNVNALVTDAVMLSGAAVEGRLATRADATKHGGEFRKIVEGVNNTLDAVIKPVNEAAEVLQEMSAGNLQVRVKGNYQGDHADIKNALNNTLDALSDYVTEIAAVLSEMANGNMNQQITSDYRGDFSAIKEALNLILESLNTTLGDINTAADQVAAGSNQVSDGSQALSQGTTEQASSIEQLTSSINEVANQTRKNAMSANEANELAVTASTNAERGNGQMQDMLKAMTDINTSSNNISKIIKVIDDIAFQTNILALNAAVEAARAGQHGKGFAVVAEEVRTLAARSASAAKETTGMIEGSIDKVQAGTRIANETAEALDKIVGDVSKVATLVSSIANASNDQATAITQINQGVEQVSQVIQTNSATAEQSAAASEELSSQADLLKEMVSRFRLRSQGGGVPKLAAAEPTRKLPGAVRNEGKSGVKKRTGETGKPKISLNDRDFGKY